jgi:hypothetical protein
VIESVQVDIVLDLLHTVRHPSREAGRDDSGEVVIDAIEPFAAHSQVEPLILGVVG